MPNGIAKQRIFAPQQMNETDGSIVRGWRLYVFLIPAFLFSVGLFQLFGYFDGLWLSHQRHVAPPVPFDLQILFGIGQTAKWAPAGIVVYWLLGLPQVLGRWLLAEDILLGAVAMAFVQLLVLLLYAGGSVAAYFLR